MPDEKTEERNYIFAKDPESCRLGFATHGEAKTEAGKIPEDGETRVRVRYRNRTGKFDVIIKRRREAKA